jgi:hypothetical protein
MLNHPDDRPVWKERSRVRMNNDLAPNCDGYVAVWCRVFVTGFCHSRDRNYVGRFFLVEVDGLSIN